jgi:hypothetical protein
VSDLQTIQSDIVNYWQQNGSLPASLDEIGQPLTGSNLPVDPQTSQSYTYTVIAKTTFKLCATFNAPTAPYAITQNDLSAPIPADPGSVSDVPDSWYHDEGEQCFERSINPVQYPKIKAS